MEPAILGRERFFSQPSKDASGLAAPICQNNSLGGLQLFSEPPFQLQESLAGRLKHRDDDDDEEEEEEAAAAAEAVTTMMMKSLAIVLTAEYMFGKLHLGPHSS